MFAAARTVSYRCGADANLLIERWLGDCLYTSWDTIAVCVGLSSVFFWVIAQLPQFISNIVRQSADALSPWFLLQWLLGDSFNFLGCILTGDQLVTQTVTAGYFIFADIIILSQYFYYQVRNKNKLDALYPDSDESMHKPRSGYHNNSADLSALEKLLEKNACGETPSKRPMNWTNNNPWFDGYSRGSSKGYHAANHDGNPQISVNVLNEGKHHGESGRIGQDLAAGSSAKGQANMPSADKGPPFLFTISDKKKQDGWMYEHRHRLRRIVQEYGLECGHGTSTRLNRVYKHRQTERSAKHPSLPKKGPHTGRVLSAKARNKALLGVACLFGLVLKTVYVSPPLRNDSVQYGQVLVGRRALLSLHSAADALPLSPLAAGAMDHSFLAATGVQLIGLDHFAICWTKVIGRLVGWVSSVLYLGSRFSQLLKNRQRRSAEGLSLGMVACAVLANLMYGAAILMRISSWDSLVGKAPWLIGSLGTVFLDFSIVIQARYYSWHLKKGVATEYTPLLA